MALQSKGEMRVGITFNPSSSALVDQLKRQAADFIDLVNTIDSDSHTPLGNERGRLKSIAMTEIESAAMWAVKAATKSEPK